MPRSSLVLLAAMAALTAPRDSDSGMLILDDPFQQAEFPDFADISLDPIEPETQPGAFGKGSSDGWKRKKKR